MPREIDFDHTDREFMQNPYEMFRTLREQLPVARSTRFDGFWVLSRYDDLIAAARDAGTFSSAGGVTIPNFGSPVPMVPVAPVTRIMPGTLPRRPTPDIGRIGSPVESSAWTR